MPPWECTFPCHPTGRWPEPCPMRLWLAGGVGRWTHTCRDTSTAPREGSRKLSPYLPGWREMSKAGRGASAGPPTLRAQGVGRAPLRLCLVQPLSWALARASVQNALPGCTTLESVNQRRAWKPLDPHTQLSRSSQCPHAPGTGWGTCGQAGSSHLQQRWPERGR